MIDSDAPMDEAYIGLDSRTYPRDETHITENCARCGGTHAGLTTVAFYRPVVDDHYWRWWSTCPTTGDPILIADANEPPLAVPRTYGSTTHD